jgi:perosamine synthetase
MRARLLRLAPGGSAISAASLGAVLREPDPERALRRGLMERLPSQWLSLHRSGREALRIAFSQLAAASGRGEVIVPAYGCYSIPAAAVAAGLRVRLVDVDLAGQIDPESLRGLPLERAAALVIGNLFGVPEPVADALELARAGGVPVIDDAAQSLGAGSAEGPVGARGDVGVLSFGRGKPLSALGGGALAWKQRPDPLPEDLALDVAGDPAAPAQRASAALRALAYDLARAPVVLRALAAIPALGIGATVYDPGFRRGAIEGACVALAAALLPRLDAMNHSRARTARALAQRLEAETGFRPLVARAGEVAVHPRLALLAPDAAARDAALASLGWLGVTAMYPSTLDRVAALTPHLAGEADCPGAHAFCSRLLTVPTHAGVWGRRIEELVVRLRRLT